MGRDDGLRRARGAAPAGDPRSPARGGALGRRARRLRGADAARRLQAPQGAARGRARGRPRRRQAPPLRAAPRAARRGRRLARPLPRVLVRPSRRPGATPGGEPMRTDGAYVHEDGRPALRFERRLPHPIERVWRAVSEPAELERWFPAVVPWTPRPGETFEAFGQRGEVTAVEPPQLLAWDFGEERYRFELAHDGDGCLLVFTHVLAGP